MRIGTPDDGNAAAGKTQRIAYDTLADGVRPRLQRPDRRRRRRAHRRRPRRRRSACTTRCTPTPASPQ